jgi:hypothetical protein
MKLIEAIRDVVNQGEGTTTITFERDWGDNSLTLYINNSHTHLGIPGKDGSLEQLEQDAINALIGGPGLSFVKDCQT